MSESGDLLFISYSLTLHSDGRMSPLQRELGTLMCGRNLCNHGPSDYSDGRGEKDKPTAGPKTTGTTPAGVKVKPTTGPKTTGTTPAGVKVKPK